MAARHISIVTVLVMACTGVGPIDGPAPGVCSEPDECPSGQTCRGGWCVASGGDLDLPTRGAIAHLLTESVRFSDVGRGITQVRSIRLENLGDETLEIDRVDTTGTSGRVTVSPQPNDSLIAVPPGVELGFAVTFTGSDGVAFAGTVTIYSSDWLAPRLTVPVVVGYTGAPEVVITRTPAGQHAESIAGEIVTLGPILDGVQREERFYVKNLGIGGMYATLEAPTIEDDANGAFTATLTPGPDSDGAYRLGRFAGFCSAASDCPLAESTCAAQVCWRDSTVSCDDCYVLTVGVTAATGIVEEATLRLHYTSPNGGFGGNLEVGMVAQGVEAGLYVEAAVIDFGPVSIGFPQSRVARLVNASGAELTVDAMTLTGAGAEPPLPPISATALSGPLPLPLAPFEESFVRIDFHPTPERLGLTEAWLEILGNDGSTATVVISGTARIGPAIATEPLAELDAGTAHVQTPATAVVTVINGAVSTADDLAVTWVGATITQGVGSLSVAPAAPLPPIPPGAAAQLTAACISDLRAEVMGVLSIESDAPDNPVRTLTVRCRGIDPDLRLSYQSRDNGDLHTVSLLDDHACRGVMPSPCMDLGEVYAGRETDLTVELINTGEDPLTIAALGIEPVGVPFDLVEGVTGFSLLPAEARPVTVRYHGTGVGGTTTGRLRIEHDDADTGPVELGLMASEANCAPGLRACPGLADCSALGTTRACCREADDPDACGAACTVCPFYTHTVRGCDGNDCEYACQPGYHDLDASPGCEYECFETSSGAETCDGLDNDCNGSIDDGLGLGDGADGLTEVPEVCTPESLEGLLGLFNEDDLGELVIGGSGEPEELTTFDGRIYVSTGDPAGDVDWLRLLFAEVNACDAVGFRLEVSLVAPVDTDLEICGSLVTPGGAALFAVPCAEDGGEPIFDACLPDGVGTLRFEWAEICGVADNRVLDLRIRAASGALPQRAASCDFYSVEVRGARLF